MINYKVRVRNLVNKHGANDPIQLAQSLDIKTIHAPLPNNIRGFLVRVLKLKYIILNDRLCYQAQKLTICHEIGHDQLHKGYGYYFHADHTYYIPCAREREANEYAIHLLAQTSNINAEVLAGIINIRQPDPKQVHNILAGLIEL